MAIKTVLFDLDGTLLPMDQEVFVKKYLSLLAARMVRHGYEPEALVKSIWAGTGAMVKNDGSKTNEQVFWDAFADRFGEGARGDEPKFYQFYVEEFDRVQEVCGYTAQAAALIEELKGRGLQLVLATNPIFPAIATRKRVRWAGLRPEDFKLITSYENSRFSKPNPAYYRDILDALELDPAECIMVGNDAQEDTAAQTLGMEVFLLTDCLINSKNKDITQWPHGDFAALRAWLKEKTE